MRIKRRVQSPISQSPPTEEVDRAADQAARARAAEEFVRRDQRLILEHEQLVAFLAALSPSDVNRFLSGISVDAIVSLLRQMPELPILVTPWGENYLESFKTPNTLGDVERLVKLGVRRESLAIAMILIKYSPVLDNSFAQFGDSRERRQRAKRLLVPLPDLLELAKMFGEIPPLASKKFPNPSKIISELKMLSSIFDWGEIIYSCLGANHFLEVSKFGLASLVHETTGKFLDRAVGNLIGAALDHNGYDETAYRVWRVNNYARLRETVPIVTRALLALNSVVSVPEVPR